MTRKRLFYLTLGTCFIILTGAYLAYRQWFALVPLSRSPEIVTSSERVPLEELAPFPRQLMKNLQAQIDAVIRYRDGYYEGGDPPDEIGVCTDVVIRAFRSAGIDLQREVALDIQTNRNAYRIDRPDPNIDHRRCRNLIVYFRRHAQELSVGNNRIQDWQPGDIVFWDARGDGGVNHVGIVGNRLDADGNPSIIHHWPGMEVEETDGLFRFPVKGHFRWKQESSTFIRILYE